MKIQHDIYDLFDGEKLKAAGMKTAAENRAEALREARLIAVQVAKRNGTVTADDVQRGLAARGISRDDLGNAAGSIFKKGFEFTGCWVKSQIASNHAREIKVWRQMQL